MSALMTPRRARRNGRAKATKPAGQPSLFAAAATAAAPTPVAPPAPRPAEAPAVPAPEALQAAASAVAPAPPAPRLTAAPEIAAVPETFTTASARRQGPTLDDLVAGAWEGLLAGAPADCLVCGAPVAPRHSAGAGIVGGRCGGCGSTLG
jgi:hypothetical protein